MAKPKKTGLYEIEWATVSYRSIRLFLLIIAGLIFFVIWWFYLRTVNPDVQFKGGATLDSAARFIDYEGRVEVKPKDEFVWKVADFKMELEEGDRVRTAPDSSARIRFDDGTEITVQTDSIVSISKRSMSDNEAAPLAVVENGQSDINVEKSATPASVASDKIRRFKLAPGSTGTIIADQQSGVHTSVVEKGYGVVTDTRGTSTKLSNLEELRIEKDNTLTKSKLPFIPPLISPQKGQLFEFLSDQGLTVELKWRDVSNAVRYHVQISESPLFAKLSAENRALARNSIAIKIPKAQKKQYFWRVRSLDANNKKSPWSDPYQFVVYSATVSKKTESSDKTPPVLKITSMHSFLPFVQVEGQTEPDAFLTLNGQIIDVREDGTFVYTYTLQQSGVNDLKFVAEDPAGNKSTVLRQVKY